MQIEWSEEAIADLTALLEYLDEQDPRISQTIIKRIRAAEKVITTLPKSSRHNEKSDTYDRPVPKTRLLLTYRIEEERIVIVQLWHTSRDPDDQTGTVICSEYHNIRNAHWMMSAIGS